MNMKCGNTTGNQIPVLLKHEYKYREVFSLGGLTGKKILHYLHKGDRRL